MLASSNRPPPAPTKLGCSQSASQERADSDAQLAAVTKGERELLFRLGWLAEQYPLVESRLADVDRQVAPPAGTAVAALQDLSKRIEAAKPPLAEAEAARDAAVAALVGDLAMAKLVRCCGCRCCHWLLPFSAASLLPFAAAICCPGLHCAC